MTDLQILQAFAIVGACAIAALLTKAIIWLDDPRKGKHHDFRCH